MAIIQQSAIIQQPNADFLPTWHGTIAQQGHELSLRHISASVAYTPSPSANHGPATRTSSRAHAGARRRLPQSDSRPLS
ncbi:hypothetical protein EP30_10520 [Bifidobacterium sp. UTCIF-39]|uniref:hypothetical protein n=1 Tax=Bifidobacterium sp. UTCIF-39 TaxID=1465359 RepID=UPI00112A7741|nr:hypothetical protein [Bifidobacterium sp. UTCIF-39]TPF95591.1 hypothetical protein EP30_10520 [Bifidobacterium sp. UTCIF-39]